jgi:hypothetical protein
MSFEVLLRQQEKLLGAVQVRELIQEELLCIHIQSDIKS